MTFAGFKGALLSKITAVKSALLSTLSGIKSVLLMNHGAETEIEQDLNSWGQQRLTANSRKTSNEMPPDITTRTAPEAQNSQQKLTKKQKL